MNSRVAYPFLLLPDHAVLFGGWMIGDPGQPLSDAEEMLENWDYARDLEVRAELSIDWLQAADALKLPAEELRLKIVLLAGTGTGRLPRRQDRLKVETIGPENPTVSLASVVPGCNLSGRLRLAVHVLLEAPASAGTVLSPKFRGSKLWQRHKDILIEDGGDSRFPVETASFSQCFKGLPQESAPWYVHWRPSAMQADFSGSVRLYVNSDRSDMVQRFVDGDELTLQTMLGDVISQMVASVLDQEGCAEVLAECEEGSVGQQIRGWMDLAFPGQDVTSIRALRDVFPGRFRAAILAASELGGVG